MVAKISLIKAIEEYRDIYLAYRNFAQRTRIEYVNDLEDLVKYLDGVGVHNVGEVELPHLVRYFAELEKRGFAGSTRKRKTISIRSFLSFSHMEGYILSDIGKRLIPPYVEARKPHFLTTEETEQLLACAKNNKRDYAIMQLMLQTGIRLSELTWLTLNDLQITDTVDDKGEKVRYIRVIGNQRNNDRVIPLNQKASSALDDYLSKRKTSSNEFLFLNRIGERMSGRGVEKIGAKYFKLANITNATVNSLRHTFGTNQMARGVNLKVIQKMMGHKDSRTTSLYIEIGNELRKDVQ